KDGKGWDIRSGRYLAEHIPGARFVELSGADFSPSFGEQEPVFAELESFLADVVAGAHPEVEPDRVLATVLFSDIVDSSERAATLGDRAWRELLLRHHELVRRQLVRFHGREVDTAGDGFFASFDGPARAIRCGSVCTRVSASSLTARWPASPCIRGPESPPMRSRARCSSPPPSRTWSPA